MLAQQKTLVILAVLLIAPISTAIQHPVVEDSDIREIAASNWHSIEPVETSTSSLKSLDYQIHLQYQSLLIIELLEQKVILILVE